MTQPVDPALGRAPLAPREIETAKTESRDGLYYARKRDGGVVRVTPEELANSPGLSPVNPAEAEDYDRTERVRKAFEGPIMGYAASALAGARAASMGGLDLAATSLLPDKWANAYRVGVEALEEGHPLASFLGAGVGTVLPFAVTGGAAGAVAKASPMVMTDAIGSVAKAGVQRALGEGALGTGAGWAAKMGLEAGLWNTANNAALARMRDEPITADKLWSGNPGAIMFGGALGMFGGTVAGGIGALARRAHGSKVLQETGADMVNYGMHGTDAHPALSPHMQDELGRLTADAFGPNTKTHEFASAVSAGKVSADTLKLGERSAKTRLAINNPDLAMAQVGEVLSTNLNRLDEVDTVYQLAAGGKNKIRHNAKLFDGDVNQTFRAVDSKLDELSMDLQALTEEHQIGHIIDKGKYRKAGETLPDYIAGSRERVGASRLNVAREADSGAIDAAIDLQDKANKEAKRLAILQERAEAEAAAAMQRREVARAAHVEAIDFAPSVKNKKLRKLSDEMTIAERQMEVSKAQLDDIANKASLASADARAAKSNLDKLVDDLIATSPDGVKRQLAAETISEFEEVKRLIGSVAKDETAPTSWQGIKQKFRREADPDAVGSMAHALSDPVMVGNELSKVNRRVNRLVYESIHADNPIKGLRQSTGVPDPDMPWRVDFKQHSPAGLKNTLGTMTAPSQTETLEHFRRTAAQKRELAEALLEHYDLTPAELARLKSAQDAGEMILRELDDNVAHNALGTLKVVNQTKALGKGSNPALRIWGSMLGGMVGGPLGTPLGFLAGSKMASALNPLETTHYMAGLERIYGNADRWQVKWARKILGFKDLDHGADKVFKLDAPPVKTGSKRTGSLATAGKMTRALLYEAFREAGDNDDAAYAKHMAVLKKMTEQPDLVEYGIREQMGRAGEQMPGTVAGLTAKSVSAAQALLDLAPSADKNPTDMPWNAMPPTDRERREVEEAYEALIDPHTALEGFMEGEVSPKTLGLLDQVIPMEMAQIREQLTATMQAMQAAPPRRVRVQLSILLRKPVDISMTPDYQMAVQATHDARAAVKQEQKANYRNRRSYGSDGVHNNTSADRREAGEYPK